MTTTEAQAKSIDGRTRTVRELLDKAKYAIDFYQREFAWQARQVRELIDDLTGRCLDSYEPGHSRHAVASAASSLDCHQASGGPRSKRLLPIWFRANGRPA